MNVLLSPWEFPPFDQITTADFDPAIRAAIAQAEQNIESIATNPAQPTFENTVEALECASQQLDRVSALMANLNECHTSNELQAVAMRLEPEITRFSTRVMNDRRLYDRLQCVPAEPLTDEQQTLLEQMLRSFRRHGVALEGEERERYQRNEEELSRLKLQFSQNALADLNAWTLHLTRDEELDGLPETVRAAAHEEAANRGLEGWLFTLAYPSYGPFMTYSRRRDLRERMYRAYNAIGNHGGEHDNNETIRRIVTLRAEQARLLGYNTYCDYVLADRMMGSLPKLRRFMQEMKDAVLPKAQSELKELSDYSVYSEKSDGSEKSIMPWDISYLSEKMKQQHYNIDSEALRPYFPLEAVREGIFGLYGRLYGLRIEEVDDVPKYHPDVRVYRVMDGERLMGLLYLDMHPRPSKRSGAWMTEFRGQYGEVRPQIQVVCNFSKPTADSPSLLRFSEVETFMHEMGHAMHGLLSEVHYESLSGTNVKRDFVEMPSQLMENWCYEPEFLATFARHWQTGEPLPAEQVTRIRQARNHMAAWLCLRQLNLGLTDIAFHTVPDGSTVGKAEEVEAEAMVNLLPRVEGCCTATNFSHIFSGGYASGYYGYKWAEVLEANAFARFKEEGIFNPQTAADFRREVLSKGGSQQPGVLFDRFLGRPIDYNALLKRMNLLP